MKKLINKMRTIAMKIVGMEKYEEIWIKQKVC